MRYPESGTLAARNRARGASVETINRAIEAVRTKELTLAEAAKKHRIGHSRLSAAYRRAGHAYPRLKRGRPPKHEQREPQNAGSSGGDYIPGPIVGDCKRCRVRKAYPGGAGFCMACDRESVCGCATPVPLTSSRETVCRKCGGALLARAAKRSA